MDTLLNQRLDQQIDGYLNDFAFTRGYNDINHAVTYIHSSVTEWVAEAQRCIYLRDQCYLAYEQVCAEIDAGTRPEPLDLVDFMDAMPELTWAD